MRSLLVAAAILATAHAQDVYDIVVPAFSVAGSGATASYGSDGMAYVTTDCTSDSVTNADQDQYDRWLGVSSDQAFEMAIINWFYDGVTGSLTFPEYVSNFFNGPEGMNCGATAPSVGCESPTQCDDVNHPAGYFILNSFVSVHSMLYNFFDAFTTAEADMTTSIGTFSSTFAQIEDVQAEIDMILNVLGLGYALAVAPVWNKWLKEMPAFSKSSASNWLGTAKDSMNGLVSNGITIIKSTGAWADTQNNQNLLSYYMGELIKSWATGISDTNEQLFNGSVPSIENLYRLIDEGQVMEETSTSGTMDIVQYIEQSLYPILIPYAWSLSNMNSHPFVMDSGYDCSNTYPDLYHDYMTQEVADAVSVCYNDKLYYLLDARNCQVDCGAQVSMHGSVCSPTQFDVPLGTETMDGAAWGGVTVANLTISAVNGYVNNGNANGWALLNPEVAAEMDRIWNDGINAAGVVQIPVCDFGTAQYNWINCDVDADNYPCQPIV
ncbi:hypothetical protein G7Z17_g159 [Cylindrodendrum hubeiense]|uniref:Uncharacterized protein n=1 Tax=Cylindrodendrum hubeiense TaxID=595255 RepID=A0A9P5LDP4_9HYPO|nr:hypothetical protein G7Z17_g159 [Cylindrodendrum hubeiense]